MTVKQQWVKTLTVAERAAALGKHEIRGEDKPSRLFLDWSAQPPFDDEAKFSERLAADGLTEPQFVRLLNEPAADLAARFSETPDWVGTVLNACSNPAPRSIGWPAQVMAHPMYGFLAALEPLIADHLAQIENSLRGTITASDELPFAFETLDGIVLAPVPEHLFRMASRTLILELNVARVRGQLPADTPEDRFRQFFERLREPEALSSLLGEYAVLARQLVIYLREWAESSVEFICRLCADWKAIQTDLAPPGHPGRLVRWDSGLGDRHNGGRTVGIAYFDSGFRVVYKPRPQQLAAHFQDFLRWLNAHGLTCPFRTLKILDRGEYGWMEFVSGATCETEEEVARFYQRQGGYLALLYLLSGTDVHAENLMASGEHPMLIDVETLFHPVPHDRVIPPWLRPAARAMQESVIRSLLLPVRLMADDEQDGIDFSALGAQGGQLYPAPVPYWEGSGTDAMRVAHKRVPMAELSNRPTLRGQEVQVSGYLESVVSGFEAVYRFVLGRRDELLSEGGPLARFAGDEVRIILRATRTYAGLLQESFHPNLLRDALPRDRLFDYLWRQVPFQPSLRPLIASEKDDLHRGNIPFFVVRTDARDLRDSAGRCFPGFFPETSLDLVRRRVAGWSERDLDDQLWLIRASFLALPDPPRPSVTPIAARSEPAPRAPFDRRRLLDAAVAAANRVEALARHDGGYVSWIGLTPGGRSSAFLITPAGLDLYDGLPGIALFLAYAGQVTGERRYTTLAANTLATIQSQRDDTQERISSIGAFTGWGGLLHLYTHLAVLWGRDDLFEAAELAVGEIANRLAADERLDVIGGAAGSIATLLGLYGVRRSQRALDTAVACGDHLLAQARTYPNGLGWLTTVGAKQPVTGFSHGSAGIAWALARLAQESGEQRFAAAAASAVAYERSAFSETLRNWRSLRDDEVEGEEKVAWCYGAPGIGLARLNSPQTDPGFRDEIETSLRTTLEYVPGFNQSLCHGDWGNLELVLQASLRPGGELWRPPLEAAASAVLDRIDERGWQGGTLSVTGPGLMTGIAGIGYQSFRLAEPSQVPSILTLEPPASPR